MKKSLQILTSLFIFAAVNYCHDQRVHQYVVVEAYKLLKYNIGYSISEFENHIGGIGGSFNGDFAWQKPYITTGAFREDEEDVIFNYDVIGIPGINYALVSITHFWNADDGDLNKNMFSIKVGSFPAVNIGPYENAYDKLMRFANGNWVLWFPDVIECKDLNTNHNLIITPIPALPPKRLGVSVKYDSLLNFYKTSILNLVWNQYSSYNVFDINTQQLIPPESVSQIQIQTSVRDRIVWEVLGRMCHLLGDMSVPAHAHKDEHGTLADSYEDWMAGNGNPYLNWTYLNAGDFINPFNSDKEPLHYLFYTMQQQSDHFGSNGPGSIGNGDDIIGGMPRPQELNFLNSVNLSSFGQPVTSNGPWSTTNLENIRDKTFPFLIRATAGLLFWFAEMTNLTWIEDVATENFDFRLHQNYPNPFNPNTKIKYSIPPVGTQRAVSVQIKVYDMLGNEVATLADEYKPAGNYEVTWNAGDLPSGVYFYRIQAGNFSDMKKMILMK